MDDASARDGWSDAQWGRVLSAIAEEAGRTRVAASALPIHGPLAPGAQVVPADRLEFNEAEGRLEVDDVDTVRVVTIQAEVSLKGAQMADPDMASALLLFRRTANLVARMEDLLVFRGADVAEGDRRALAPVVVSGRGKWPGLVHAGRERPGGPIRMEGGDGGARGERLVTAVVAAISRLEQSGYGEPFVAVLDDHLFGDATTPNRSLVMPRDRIEPYLSGPLRRSSALPARTGVVVSLAGNPIDIALAQDMTAQFLQISREPRYVFRVYERLALRVKDPAAVVAIVDGDAA